MSCSCNDRDSPRLVFDEIIASNNAYHTRPDSWRFLGGAEGGLAIYVESTDISITGSPQIWAIPQYSADGQNWTDGPAYLLNGASLLGGNPFFFASLTESQIVPGMLCRLQFWGVSGAVVRVRVWARPLPKEAELAGNGDAAAPSAPCAGAQSAAGASCGCRDKPAADPSLRAPERPGPGEGLPIGGTWGPDSPTAAPRVIPIDGDPADMEEIEYCLLDQFMVQAATSYARPLWNVGVYKKLAIRVEVETAAAVWSPTPQLTLTAEGSGDGLTWATIGPVINQANVASGRTVISVGTDVGWAMHARLGLIVNGSGWEGRVRIYVSLARDAVNDDRPPSAMELLARRIAQLAAATVRAEAAAVRGQGSLGLRVRQVLAEERATAERRPLVETKLVFDENLHTGAGEVPTRPEWEDFFAGAEKVAVFAEAQLIYLAAGAVGSVLALKLQESPTGAAWATLFTSNSGQLTTTIGATSTFSTDFSGKFVGALGRLMAENQALDGATMYRVRIWATVTRKAESIEDDLDAGAEASDAPSLAREALARGATLMPDRVRALARPVYRRPALLAAETPNLALRSITALAGIGVGGLLDYPYVPAECRRLADQVAALETMIGHWQTLLQDGDYGGDKAELASGGCPRLC